jgi:alpha-mannosidase
MGYKTFWVRPAATTQPVDKVPAAVRVADWKIENASFALQFDPRVGDLIKIRDQQRNADLLREDGRGNEIQIQQETGSTEGDLNWGKEKTSPKPLEPWNGWKVVETGPVRTTVRIRNNLPENAAVDRFVTLYADPRVPWVSFRTHFEWNGINKMVKVAFATPYRNAKPSYDIPYGSITREASGQERPAINWVDLSEDAGGVSLLNDCRYGHDVKDGVIRLDAIRSKTVRTHTEAGHQEVTYALYPHAGDWRRGRVMHRGYEFNNPLIAVPTLAHEGRLPSAGSFVTVDASNVILSVIKQAEDSDRLIARAYEINGEKCTADFDVSKLDLTRATLTNMLEKSLPGAPPTSRPEGLSEIHVPVNAYEIVTIQLQ